MIILETLLALAELGERLWFHVVDKPIDRFWDIVIDFLAGRLH